MNSKGNLTSLNEYMLGDRYPVHRACRDGDISALESALRFYGEESEKTRIYYCEDSFYGWMPIHWASYHGHLACIRKLLISTAETPSIGQNHINNVHLNVWNSLIDAQASNFRQAPVHLAAYTNHVDCLKWLLDAGASLHITDALSETAAHKAARCGSFECLSLLVAHGVNLSVVNNAGQTASDLAAACGHTKCSSDLQRLQNGGSPGFVASRSVDEASTMDIDQNGCQPLFVSGMYGYQPCYAKAVNGRKRCSHGDVLDIEKRCKKSWKKDDPNGIQQRRNEIACTRSWMSSHCLM